MTLMKKSKKKKTQTNKSDSTMVQSPGNKANFYTLSYLIFIIVYKLKAFLLQGASNHEKTNKRNNLALLDVARGGGGRRRKDMHWRGRQVFLLLKNASCQGGPFLIISVGLSCFDLVLRT